MPPYPPRYHHSPGLQIPAQGTRPSTISEYPMLALRSQGLAEVRWPFGAVQSLPRISVLSLSGYICEITSFQPAGLTLIMATSLWKSSVHWNKNQSQKGKIAELSVHNYWLDLRSSYWDVRRQIFRAWGSWERRDQSARFLRCLARFCGVCGSATRWSKTQFRRSVDQGIFSRDDAKGANGFWRACRRDQVVQSSEWAWHAGAISGEEAQKWW